MHIQFLWWEACPSHPEAWRRLQQVLDELDIDAEIERIEMRDDADAQRWQFRGSPTILVNGADIDPHAAALPARLTCRLYHTEDGRPSPLPSRALIKRAIIRAQAETGSKNC